MKIATMLLPLLLLAASTLARPSLTESPPVLTGDSQPQEQEQPKLLVRERRAPEDDRGSVTGGVHHEKGVGTVVQAQGEGNVWKSDDGNARVDAHGDWSKVVDGPGRGKPNYNVGIKFTGRF